MRKYSFIFVLAMLSACATVETYHNACIQGHETIAAQVACVKANIAQDQYLREDTLAQEYINTGDLLVQQVADGEIDEKEAQLKFVQTLNKIRLDELREQAYEAQIDRANRDRWPRETECERRDGSFYCTTY